MDGILFSRNRGITISGQKSNEIPYRIRPQSFSRPSGLWYCLQVKEENTQAGTSQFVQYIPLAEYNRGGFWVGASTFEYFKLLNNQFTRWWLDDFLHIRLLYKALHASDHSQTYTVQDLALPYPTLENLTDYTIEPLGIWPLYLCPLRQTRLLTLRTHSS